METTAETASDIDIAALRRRFPSARDVLQDGPHGVVIVFENRGDAGTAVRVLADVLEVLFARVPGKVGYFSTAYNANAYSCHIHFKPEPHTPIRVG